MKKRVPRLRTDEEAEKFLEKDLADYIDPAHMVPFRFEFETKNKAVNIRLSEGLLKAIQARARKEGIPYQRFIRMALEKALQPANKPLLR